MSHNFINHILPNSFRFIVNTIINLNSINNSNLALRPYNPLNTTLIHSRLCHHTRNHYRLLSLHSLSLINLLLPELTLLPLELNLLPLELSLLQRELSSHHHLMVDLNHLHNLPMLDHNRPHNLPTLNLNHLLSHLTLSLIIRLQFHHKFQGFPSQFHKFNVVNPRSLHTCHIVTLVVQIALILLHILSNVPPLHRN